MIWTLYQISLVLNKISPKVVQSSATTTTTTTTSTSTTTTTTTTTIDNNNNSNEKWNIWEELFQNTVE